MIKEIPDQQRFINIVVIGLRADVIGDTDRKSFFLMLFSVFSGYDPTVSRFLRIVRNLPDSIYFYCSRNLCGLAHVADHTLGNAPCCSGLFDVFQKAASFQTEILLVNLILLYGTVRNISTEF